MKNLKTRFLWLVTLMVVSVASYAYDACIDGIYYYLNAEGKTAVVTSGDSNYSGCVTIPSTITHEGVIYSVTRIDKYASWYCHGLTSVTIPSSVTSIGSYAFAGCSGLTSVTIPSSVTSIGEKAFDGTAWYNNQPDGLVYAGAVAYKYKGTMPEGTMITIKEGTKVIGYMTFANCTGMTSVTIPSSVTSIGYEAFYHCSGLTSATIPESVMSLGDEAFSGCTGLTSVTIPSSITCIGYEAFQYCSSLTSVTIPSSITSIDSNAFYNCM